MNDERASLRRLRDGYRAIRGALPWLDAAPWPDDPPSFPKHARPSSLPRAEVAKFDPALPGQLDGLQRDGKVPVLRFDPALCPSPSSQPELLEQLADLRIPLVLLHTDLDLDRVEELARAYPRLTVILESGPRKILYDFDRILAALGRNANLHLGTHNLCNWLALERVCDAGLGSRLLFGTHAPRFHEDVAMAPIILGRLTWRQKCDLAGNNLRRLLGIPPVEPPEVALKLLTPFIIDAHAHNGPAERFSVPDGAFSPDDWVAFLDSVAVRRIFLSPSPSLGPEARDPLETVGPLLARFPDRFAFYEVFHPGRSADHLERIARNLAHPACVGIKIHPSFHGVPPEDPRYDPAFQLAAERKVPVLTHSWERSPTNPFQELSLPERFEPALMKHPGLKLILGHAGGRPSTCDSVVRLCRKHPSVVVDVSGDYFDHGLVEFLAENLGADRVLYGSDLNWIDPRCTLGPVLAGNLNDDTALRILSLNAHGFFAKPTGDS